MPKYHVSEARLLGSRIIVWNPEDSLFLYKNGFYGKPVGVSKPKTDEDLKTQLELSPLEALYLMEKQLLKVKDLRGKSISKKRLFEIAKKSHRRFNDLYLVYKDLREKGYVVRPGLKFGGDFAVYLMGPGIDHAPFIVHVIPQNEKIDPVEIVRAGRLTHTVRKKFVIATIDPQSKEVRYYMFMWWKP